MGFKVDTSGFEEIERMLLKNAEAAEKYAEPILKAGAGEIVKAQKSELARLAKSDRSIGTLEKSIGTGRIKKSRSGTGIHTDVFPQGNQPHGYPRKGKRGNVSNAQVGFVLEYGRSNMPARPWIGAANAKAAGKANEAMAKEWEQVSYG